MKRMLLLLIVAGFSFAAFNQGSNAEKKDSLMKAISSAPGTMNRAGRVHSHRQM